MGGIGMTENCKKWLYIVMLLLITALLMSGCRSTKEVPMETVHVKTVDIRDTIRTVYLSPSVQTNVVDEADTSEVVNEYARSTAWVENGLLHHRMETKDSARVSVPVTVINETTEKPVIIYKEKELTKKQKFILEYSWVSILINVACFLGLVMFFKMRGGKSSAGD
jgi:uncharacterized protein YcfL